MSDADNTQGSTPGYSAGPRWTRAGKITTVAIILVALVVVIGIALIQKYTYGTTKSLSALTCSDWVGLTVTQQSNVVEELDKQNGGTMEVAFQATLDWYNTTPIAGTVGYIDSLCHRGDGYFPLPAGRISDLWSLTLVPGQP